MLQRLVIRVAIWRAPGPGGSVPAVRRPWLALLPALALLAIAGWEIVVTVRAGDDVPGDGAWRQAAALVRQRHQPGELIVFAPAWNDPVGRMHVGDLMTLDEVARMDAARFGVIWELSIRGARAPETAGLSTADVAEVGGITIRRFERAPAVVVADVVALAGSAKIEGRGRPGVVVTEVGFAPHRCVQVQPTPGAPLRITWPALPLGTRLVGYVGLADIFKRRDATAPARLDVELGGQVVASVTMTNTSGWMRFEAPTTPGPSDVTFVATVEGKGAAARDRLVCFGAEARQ
jgi:hypothetical protein